MKNKLYLIIACCALQLCYCMTGIASTTQDEKAISTITYINEEMKYSIAYPSDWVKERVSRHIDLSILAPSTDGSSKSKTSMSIMSDYSDESVGLEEMLSQMITFTSKEGFNIHSGDATLNGIPSKWVIYPPKFGQEAPLVLQYMIIVQDRLYFITFSTEKEDFDNFYPKFQQIASTFQSL